MTIVALHWIMFRFHLLTQLQYFFNVGPGVVDTGERAAVDRIYKGICVAKKST